jgi:hypothetical protein
VSKKIGLAALCLMLAGCAIEMRFESTPSADYLGCRTDLRRHPGSLGWYQLGQQNEICFITDDADTICTRRGHRIVSFRESSLELVRRIAEIRAMLK